MSGLPSRASRWTALLGTGVVVAAGLVWLPEAASAASAPGVPTTLVGTPGNVQVALSWKAPSSNGGAAITDYRIQYKLTSASTWTTFNDGTSTAVAATVTGLVNGTGYDFKVAAVNSVGVGSYTAAVSSTPRTTPGAPTGLAATAGAGQASLSWTAPTASGGAAITDYVVQYKLTSASTWSTFADGTSTVTKATVTGLTNASSYDFRVAATNVAGTGATSTTASATPRTVPGTPTALAAAAGDGRLTLTWTAPASNGGAAVTDYKIEYKATAGTTWSVFAHTASAATTATVTGLSNGTGYDARVSAVNAAGTGTASTVASGTPRTVAGAPGSLVATPGDGAVALTWTAPTATGGAAVTDYTIESRPSGGSWTAFAHTASTATSAALTGLTNGTTYEIRVSAVNAAGTGSPATSVTATPRTVPGAPQTLAAISGDRALTVSWTAPASNGGAAVTAYQVQYKTTAGTTWTSLASTAALTQTITGLVNGTSYDVRVSATNVAGTGPATAAVTAVARTVPAAPTGFAATGVTTSSAILSWTAPASDGGSPVTGYRVRATTGGTTTTTNVSGTSTTLTGLAGGTAYTVTVTAVSAAGESPAATIAVTTVTPPRQPSAWSATVAAATAQVTTRSGSGAAAQVDGTAATAALEDPAGFSIAGGYGYFHDRGSIRRVELATGAVSTVAGNGTADCVDSAAPGTARIGWTADGLVNDGVYLYWQDWCPPSYGTYPYYRTYTLRRMALATGAVSSLGAYWFTGMTIGPDGSLLVASYDTVQRVDWAAGTVTTVLTLPAGERGNTRWIGALTADATSVWAQTFPSGSNWCCQEILQLSLTAGTVTSRWTDATGASVLQRSALGLTSAGDYLYLTTANGPLLRQFRKSDGTWRDVAGAGPGYLDGAGAQAWLASVSGLDTDGSGLWVLDGSNHRIRQVSAAQALTATQPGRWSTTVAMSSGTVSTVAGDGGSALRDGTGTAAGLADPTALSLVGGKAYFSDGAYLRTVDTATGAVSTVGGTGAAGCTDSADPRQATVGGSADSMANDGTFLYFMDRCPGSYSYYTNPRLRRMSLATGAISSFPGWVYGGALTVGPDGSLYVAAGSDVQRVDWLRQQLVTVATLPAGPNYGQNVLALAADADGIWAISANTCTSQDASNSGTCYHSLFRIDPTSGAVTKSYQDDGLAAFRPLGPLVSAGSYLYTPGQRGSLLRFTKSTGAWTNVVGAGSGYLDGPGAQAWFGAVSGLDTDGTGLLVLDRGNHRVRRVTPGTALPAAQPDAWSHGVRLDPAKADVVAGSGAAEVKDGTGTAASLAGPSGLSLVGSTGYFAEAGWLRTVDVDSGVVRTVAGTGTVGCADADDPSHATVGNGVKEMANDGTFLYFLDNCPQRWGGYFTLTLRRMSLATGAVSTYPGQLNTTAFTIGADGRLYVTEGAEVRRVDWGTGTRTTVGTIAMGPGVYGVTPVAMAADADAVYTASVGTCLGSIWSYSCDYRITRVEPATGASKALFVQPEIDSQFYPGGPMLSAGRYLYTAMTGGTLTGVGVWTKSGGWVTSLAGPDGAALNVGSATGLAMRGTDLFVLSGDARKLYRVHQAPAEGPHGLQSVGGGTGAGGAAVTGPSGILTATEGTACDTPVDQITGDYCASATDLGFAGRGGGLAFTRTYDTRRRNLSERLGMGWTDSYDWSVLWDSADPSQATVLHGTGSEIVFHADYSGPTEVFKGPDGAGELKFLATQWTYTVADATTYTFDARGRLTGILDLKSDTMTLLNRDNNGRLVEAFAGAGRWLHFGYDDFGRIASVTDPSGRTVTYGYTDLDLTDVVDVNGGHWKVSYDAIHRITALADPLGRATQVTYNFGRTTTYTDRGGSTTRFAYAYGDPGELIRDVTDAAWNTTRYTYRNNLLVSEIHAYGTPIAATTKYEYDPATATISAVIDTTNRATRYTRDALGNVLTQTDPIGRTATSTYNRYRLLTSTDVNGDVTSNTYDSHGNVTSTTRTKAGGGEHVTTTFHRDDANHPDDVTSITGPDGATSTLVHDANGFVTGTTDPTGRTTTATYNTLGWKTSVTSPGGHTTTYGDFTAFGAPRTITDALGRRTTSVYDVVGNLTDTTDAEGRHLHQDYDSSGRLVATTAPDGTITRTGYDALGNVISGTDELGRVTRTTYDQLNRPATTTDANGSSTQVGYDNRGNVAWTKDPAGTQVATTTYDGIDRVATVTDALNRTVTYSYPDGRTVRVQDAEGRIVETTSNYLGLRSQVKEGAAGSFAVTGRWTYDSAANVRTSFNGDSTTTFDYDAAGRLTSSQDPAGRTTTYGYDPDGNPATLTRPGSVVRYGHDAVGNLTEVDNPGSVPDVTYAYDRIGRRTRRTDGTGTTTYAYTMKGQLASVTNGATTVAYGYDDAGRQTSLTYPSGHTVQRAYDAVGRLNYVTDWAGRRSAFGWNFNGSFNSSTYANGIITRYSYDLAGQLTGLAATAGSTPVLDLAYSYDGSGLLKELADKTDAATPATRTYGWDGESRLSSLSGTDPNPGAFGFDHAGQLRSTPSTNFTVDGAGQVTASRTNGVAAATGSYGYDSRGNRFWSSNTPLVGPASGTAITQTYGYDGLDQLTSYFNSSAPDVNLAHTYDGDGLRASTTRTDAAGPKRTDYVWDVSGGLPVLLADADNEYLYGPDATPYAQVNRTTGETTYLTADAGGSTRVLTSSSGTSIGTWDYSPYGEIIKTHTSATTTPFLYAGQYRDADSGLYYLRARYYDPLTATFLTRDPAENATGLAYGYTAGNPLQYGDPSGLFWQEAWDATKGVGSALAEMASSMTNPMTMIRGVMNLPAQVSTAYEEGGLGLAINQFNPFYSMLEHGAAAYTAAKSGDWQTAGKMGALTVVDAVDVVMMAVGGAGLLRSVGSNLGRAGLRAAESCAFKSFSGDTSVLMADGSTKAISAVVVGDLVLATDPATGQQKAEAVTDLWIHDDEMRTLSVNGRSVEVTEDHPIWDAGDRTWKRADELGTGATLGAAAGLATVTAPIHGAARVARAYNMTVANLHTYFVLAGETPFLVHNCGASADGLYRNATDSFNGKKGADSPASRAYQKHMTRENTTLIELKSGKDRVDMSEHLIGDLLTNPRSAVQRYSHRDHGDVIDYLLPDIGARWAADGRFIGFLDKPNFRTLGQ